MQLRDRIRTESVLQRLGWRLSLGMVPARQQRETVRELRAGLEDAAASGDLDQALARLGEPRELARAYLVAMEPRPRWAAGIVWAGVSLGVTFLVGLALSLAFTAGLEAGGAGPGTYELWSGFAFDGDPLYVEARAADGRSMTATFSLFTPLHVTAVVAAFVLASRPWRLRRR